MIYCYLYDRDALKPKRILKVDKSVIVGAKYMFKYKPRVVASKKEPIKLTRVRDMDHYNLTLSIIVSLIDTISYFCSSFNRNSGKYSVRSVVG